MSDLAQALIGSTAIGFFLGFAVGWLLRGLRRSDGEAR